MDQYDSLNISKTSRKNINISEKKTNSYMSMSDILYKGLHSKIDDQGFNYGIYDRAIKLGRRTCSPYNQNWTVDLMYS
jgi:hypothetical protein